MASISAKQVFKFFRSLLAGNSFRCQYRKDKPVPRLFTSPVLQCDERACGTAPGAFGSKLPDRLYEDTANYARGGYYGNTCHPDSYGNKWKFRTELGTADHFRHPATWRWMCVMRSNVDRDRGKPVCEASRGRSWRIGAGRAANRKPSACHG